MSAGRSCRELGPAAEGRLLVPCPTLGEGPDATAWLADASVILATTPNNDCILDGALARLQNCKASAEGMDGQS
jgi:hypothetical protein